jgi:transposase
MRAKSEPEAESVQDRYHTEVMVKLGLDVHTKTIRYCVKDASGPVHRNGRIEATRRELDDCMNTSRKRGP